MSQETLKIALMKAIEGINANPGSAKVVFRADTALEDNLRCSASIRDFQKLTIDEPPELGGLDAGPNPVELVLAALGSCQEIMYAAYASVMGIPLRSVKVNLRGYLDLRGLFGMDGNTPPGYQKIAYETLIDSPASAEDLRKLVHTVETHCPVLDTLQRAIEVSGKVTANGQPLEVEAAA